MSGLLNVVRQDQAQEGNLQLEFEMEDGITRTLSRQSPLERRGRAGMARHTLGLVLLLGVVFLWTLSNFLGSSIFADNTYAKPFFLTYLNTSTFMLAMVPNLMRSGYRRYNEGTLYSTLRSGWSRRASRPAYKYQSDQSVEDDREDSEGLGQSSTRSSRRPRRERTHLSLLPTARLSLAFCVLWFSANYFAMACLQFTTVASTTILASTASIWTLVIGACTGIERFTWRKLCGVLASLTGIILISRVDLSSKRNVPPPSTDPTLAIPHPPISTFPNKPPAELALGDTLALLSALLYGIYTIRLKRTTLTAAPLQLNMPLFFGLVGFFNFILLAPLFPILHYTGVEVFVLPPTWHVWTILLVNASSSLLSDICWAYAMVLTSPLVVTVGLSLTIPLSLVGEMVVQGRYEGVEYWIGAAVVVCSFVFVDREEVKDEVVADEGQSRQTIGQAEDDGEREAMLPTRHPHAEPIDHR